MYRVLLLVFLVFYSNNIYSSTNDTIVLKLAKNTKTKKDFVAILELLDNNKTISQKTHNEVLDISIIRSKKYGFDMQYGQFIFKRSISKTLEDDFETAIVLANKSLKIFKKNKMYIYAALSLNTLSSMAAIKGNLQAGLDYSEQGFKYLEKGKSHEKYYRAKLNMLIVLGNNYIIHKYFDKAGKIFKQALQYSIENNDTFTQIPILINLAYVSIDKSNTISAMNYYNRALAYSIKNNSERYIAAIYSRKATLFKSQKMNDSSRFWFLKSIKLSKKISLNKNLMNCYKRLSDIEKSDGNYQLSNQYLIKYTQLKDSLSDEKQTRDLTRVQTKFNVKFKEEKIEEEKDKKRMWQMVFGISMLLFLGIIIIGVLSRNRLKLKRRVEKAEQEKNAKLSEIKAIRSQMNPHFIFNSLNSIQDLVLKQDGQNAYKYINKFAALIRKVLNHSGQEYIDIEEELYVLNTYLELERLRFKKDFDYTITSQNVKDIKLPPMLIQPFVENALKHGLLHKNGNKLLNIEFKMVNKVLVCKIEDNGIGRIKSEDIKLRKHQNYQSFSVKSTQNRFDILQELHGGSLGLKYEDLYNNNVASGTKVILKIPFKPNF